MIQQHPLAPVILHKAFDTGEHLGEIEDKCDGANSVSDSKLLLTRLQ